MTMSISRAISSAIDEANHEQEKAIASTARYATWTEVCQHWGEFTHSSILDGPVDIVRDMFGNEVTASDWRKARDEKIAKEEREMHVSKLGEIKELILELFREDYLRVGKCERCDGAGWFEYLGSQCETCHGTGFEVRNGGQRS